MSNLRHGQGEYRFASPSHKGTVLKGTWIDGKAEGPGQLVHGTSHSYQGNWTDSSPNGPGKYIFSFGCEQHGEYIPIEQDMDAQEEGDEEINASAVKMSKWRAHKITPLTVDVANVKE